MQFSLYVANKSYGWVAMTDIANRQLRRPDAIPKCHTDSARRWAVPRVVKCAVYLW